VGDEELQAFLRDWWEGIWGEGDVGLVDVLVADGYVAHGATGSRLLSHEQLKRELSDAQQHLHHAVTAIDDLVRDGDKVWFRATTRGIDRATAQPALRTWLVVHRFEDGLLAESWTAEVDDVDWES
jgi:hypothetical protein